MGRLTSTTKYLHGDQQDYDTVARLEADIIEMRAHQQPNEVIRVRVDYIDRASGELRE